MQKVSIPKQISHCLPRQSLVVTWAMVLTMQFDMEISCMGRYNWGAGVSQQLVCTSQTSCMGREVT